MARICYSTKPKNPGKSGTHNFNIFKFKLPVRLIFLSKSGLNFANPRVVTIFHAATDYEPKH
jgi:hypothetical protein